MRFNQRAGVFSTETVFFRMGLSALASAVFFLFLTNVAMAAFFTTTTVDSEGNVGETPSLAIGADGFARISYFDRTGGNLKFVKCANEDCSEKSITTVNSVGNVGLSPSLAIGADGFARISYTDWGGVDLEFVQCTNADCSEKIITTVDADGSTGLDPSLAIGADGFARISYYDWSDDGLNFAQCTNADCSEKTIVTVDTEGVVGEYSSMALDEDGFAMISYEDASNRDLKFARCTNADCSEKTIVTLDSDGEVGQFSSLVIGEDGFARISYEDNSNQDLKFIRCANKDCTDKEISTVDSTGSVGRYTSLVLGADGFARISYQGNSALKFVRCNDEDCADNEISTVDGALEVGFYTSLAIDEDGFAMISHYDSINDDLEFAREVEAPTISITAPLDSTELPEDEEFEMTVDVDDDYGFVAGVRYYINDEIATTEANAPYNSVMTIFTPGEQELIAVAIDADGNEIASSTAVSFTITDETASTVETPQPRRISSGGVHYGCKDENAANYEHFSRHKQELCRYTTQTAITNISTPTLPVRDLEFIMEGGDVLALQKLLNANGFILAETGVGSPGNETTFFGALTRAALSKYQVANGITPTAGYFGPITRAQMKAAGLAGLWW